MNDVNDSEGAARGALAAAPQKHPVDCEGGWISCWSCMGDGDYHDCGEDSCCCADPEIQERWACRECLGDGGWPCHVCEPGRHAKFMRRADAMRAGGA